MNEKLYKLVMDEMGYAKALDALYFLINQTGENESRAILQAAQTHRVQPGQLMIRWNALKTAAK